MKKDAWISCRPTTKLAGTKGGDMKKGSNPPPTFKKPPPAPAPHNVPSGLSAGLSDAVISYEYSRIVLRTDEGWVLWSESQPTETNTLGDIVRYAEQSLRNHEKNKAR